MAVGIEKIGSRIGQHEQHETPAPSALRSTAPMLPGFSTPSNTATSGRSGSTISSSRHCGVRATATMPSTARCPKGKLGEGNRIAHLDDFRLAAGQVFEQLLGFHATAKRGADEDFVKRHARGPCPRYLSGPVDQDALLFLPLTIIAQSGRLLYAGIVQAGDHVGRITSESMNLRSNFHDALKVLAINRLGEEVFGPEVFLLENAAMCRRGGEYDDRNTAEFRIAADFG